MFMPYITEAMKPARVAKGITLAEMALRIGRAVSTVTNAERGDKPMKLEYIARIARQLEIPMEQLVTDIPRKDRIAA